MRRLIAFTIFCLCAGVSAAKTDGPAPDEIFLPTTPAVSPKGKTILFASLGDIWSAPIAGGDAQRLTEHPAVDIMPFFSPDGKQIAFMSTRDGANQIYVMPASGSQPRRLTWHSEGYLAIYGWYPDGKSLLVGAMRDHNSYSRQALRLYRISSEERSGEELLFDAYAADASLSPDGKCVLFTREGVEWWRKGYVGPRATQVWLYNLENKEFKKLLDHRAGSRLPLWRPDGKAFYFVGAETGAFNIWEYTMRSGEKRQITRFDDDSVTRMALSRDGKTFVFRHLFHLYRLDPRGKKEPQRITLYDRHDADRPAEQRSVLTSADEAAFTEDGLEIAFIAGRDLWVMDTVLREPRRITTTGGGETEPMFTNDGKSILFVSDMDGQVDIRRVRRGDPKKYWWQNEIFIIDRLTTDTAVESNFSLSPDGKKMAWCKTNSGLWVGNSDGSSATLFLETWDRPDYDWSPDGKWLVYAVRDNDSNGDVWIAPLDKSRVPVNISCHPDNESNPVWSPDGKMIAFAGKRMEDEIDIYYVRLSEEDEDETSRDRKLQEALEKMEKARKKPAPKKETKPEAKATTKTLSGDAASSATLKVADGKTTGTVATDTKENTKTETAKTEEKKTPKTPEMKIDFENINERLYRISIPDSMERGLLWSPDSKKLAFSASVKGQSGFYTVEFPDKLTPKLLTSQAGRGARWVKKANTIRWVVSGKPTVMTAAGKATSYAFSVEWAISLEAWQRAAFQDAWRTMRDGFYDENLNNRDWDVVLAKYEQWAAKAPDSSLFATVVSLMLGELNGSHLGYTGSRSTWRSPDQWREETAHLGVWFDTTFSGPGLLVRVVLPGGPAEKKQSRLEVGETILAIDGTSVTLTMDLTRVLNGRRDRDIELVVADTAEKRRTVTLRPTSYSAARGMAGEKIERDRRKTVDRISDGTLGYLHVPKMDWPSFLEFEKNLAARGAGKAGLIIDVRNNGGGFTTDHLLTALCQPVHAITKPRSGGAGYPQDRMVYAIWRKPIIVLCNQNSFSNAEIFTHAIKTLGRGQVVGVETAGCVISTGSAFVGGMGRVRMPFRGWYLVGDGRDMELNGAMPHHTVWPKPGEMPSGTDAQLLKAIEVLMGDVEKTKPWPTLKNAAALRKSK